MWLLNKREVEGVNSAVIVCPTTLLNVWNTEVANIVKHFPEDFRCVLTVSVLISTTPRRERVVSHHRTCDYTYNVLITTYGLVTSTKSMSPSADDEDPHCYKYVVLDEGHRIKSPFTQMHKACLNICSPGTHRLLLSGTPIQNNLLELHALIAWCKGPELLGDAKR